MAIRLEKAFLAASQIDGDTAHINLDNDIRIVTLPSELRGQAPLRVPQSLYAVIVLAGGTQGEPVRLLCSFITPEGDSTPSVVYEETWTSKGRHIALIGLFGEELYFTEAGDYQLRFLLNGAELCSIPFTVQWEDAANGDG